MLRVFGPWQGGLGGYFGRLAILAVMRDARGANVVFGIHAVGGFGGLYRVIDQEVRHRIFQGQRGYP